MKTITIITTAIGGLLLFGFANRQDPVVLDGPALKAMITNLGYEPKELNAEVGKEKYEFTLNSHDLDIPVAAEISASKNYLWLTVFLGTPPPTDSAKNAELLKKNFEVQPSMFYVTTKGNLMMGIAVDNRSITPAVLLRNVKKITEDVGSTKDLWLASD